MRWTMAVLVCGGCAGAPSEPGATTTPAEPAPSAAPAEPSPATAPVEAAGEAPAPAPSQGGIVQGPVFHAIGQEPGWTLDVSTERGMDSLAYVGDYGSVKITFPAAARAEDPNHMSWSSTADGHTISVSAERKPCEDAMSGKPYEAAVHVVIDGRKLEGCGQAAR